MREFQERLGIVPSDPSISEPSNLIQPYAASLKSLESPKKRTLSGNQLIEINH